MSLIHVRTGAHRLRLIEAEMDKLFESGASPQSVWGRIKLRVPGVTVDELERASRRSLRRQYVKLVWQRTKLIASLSIVRIAAIVAAVFVAAIIMGAF